MSATTHSTNRATYPNATEETTYTVDLRPGMSVEVRRRFDRRWARGFVIEDETADGYRLRRNSDDSVLPVAFAAIDLRPTAHS